MENSKWNLNKKKKYNKKVEMLKICLRYNSMMHALFDSVQHSLIWLSTEKSRRETKNEEKGQWRGTRVGNQNPDVSWGKKPELINRLYVRKILVDSHLRLVFLGTIYTYKHLELCVLVIGGRRERDDSAFGILTPQTLILFTHKRRRRFSAPLHCMYPFPLFFFSVYD